LDTTPLYYQIYHNFKSKIASEDWPADTQVPTVEQLHREYGVSKVTIQKAMDILEREGLVFRKRGKGTFIRSWNLKSTLMSFKGVARYTHLDETLKTEIISSKLISPPVRIINAFSPKKITRVLLIKRLHKKEDTPIHFSYNFIRQDIAIKTKELEKMSIPKAIMSSSGVKIEKIFRMIQPWFTDSETSSTLGVSLGIPVFKFLFTGYDSAGIALYRTEVVSRIDGLILEVDVQDTD